MALKKPLNFFNAPQDDNELPVVNPDDSLRKELSKVESLSEQLYQLQQDISQKVVKNDLESLVLSQINIMHENFENLQREFKQSNKSDIHKFKEIVSEVTENINNLVENEIPKYKKQIVSNEVRISEAFDSFREVVEENISEITQEVDSKVSNIVEVVDNNLEYFNQQIEKTSLQVKKTTETYNNLSKIVENKVSKENQKFEEYSDLIENLQRAFVDFSDLLKEELFTSSQLAEEKFKDYKEEFVNIQTKHKSSVDICLEDYRKELTDVKTDVVINEQHIKNVDKYLKENHQELIDLKEEVFSEIQKLPVGNFQKNLDRLEKKIDYIKETYSKIEPEVIVKEVIKEGLLNEPPDTKNSDPLTPLDQKFVTLDQLQEHYRLFINRIQQQLSTLGGGGETQLKYLDDIVGIATNASAYNGKFLKYDHSIGKFVFATAGGGAGSQTLDDTLQLGNTSSLGMSVGVVTATSINFSNGGLLGDPYGDGGFGLKSAPNQYATIASNNLQQYIQVDNTTTYIGTGYGSTTGSYDWQFKKDGSTQFPNSLILAPTGQSITLQSDQYSQLFWMNADQTVGPDKFTNVDFFVASGYAILDIGYRDGASNQQYKSWGWSLNGLQFPDLTIQDTAFTGYAPTAGIANYATTAGVSTSVLTNPGVGIATAGGTVGTGATILDFRGSGISTITVASGIATINIIGTDISPVMMSMIF